MTLWTNRTGQPPRCGSQVGMGRWERGTGVRPQVWARVWVDMPFQSPGVLVCSSLQ